MGNYCCGESSQVVERDDLTVRFPHPRGLSVTSRSGLQLLNESTAQEDVVNFSEFYTRLDKEQFARVVQAIKKIQRHFRQIVLNRKTAHFEWFEVLDVLRERAEMIQKYNNKHPFKKTTAGMSLPTQHRIKLEDGCEYQGELENNDKCGYGQQWWPDGRFYQGTWLKNMRHGHGRFFEVDGTIYDGEWRLDKRNGHGKLSQFGSPNHYVGAFLDDKKHGRGYEVSDQGVYNGDFKNGQMHGKGKCEYANKDTYEGQFKDDARHGLGKYTQQNQKDSNAGWITIYDGAWQANLKHGEGTQLWKDGRSYIGNWQNGKRHGHGRMMNKDGTTHEGIFVNDQRHGKGKFSRPDGKSIAGEWSNNEFVRQVSDN